MKLQYCPETDSLSIELKLEPGADTREVADGLVVDIDAKREVDGFDIDQASSRLDLSTFETVPCPCGPRWPMAAGTALQDGRNPRCRA
jgi:uncharacterized protein YuzE